jgi:hypothetical protein
VKREVRYLRGLPYNRTPFQSSLFFLTNLALPVYM